MFDDKTIVRMTIVYEDGSMTSYELGLSFGELNPIYNDEIDMSSNDMGF